VRAQPRSPRSRRLLFDLLCILGQWKRAGMQLQILADTDRSFEDNATLLGKLIRAECQRAKVLRGLAAPSTFGSKDGFTPPWMLQLSEALRLIARPPAMASTALTASDALRRTALAGTPETPGRCDALPAAFDWITDSDTRLGPVCEVVLPNGYHWIALDDLQSLRMEAPTQLQDLIWSRAQFQLRHGPEFEGYMPMRYPVRAEDRDTLLLARETVWTNLGETAVLGHGQKVWSTDKGDIPLLDVRHCTFHEPGSTVAPGQ